MARPHVFKLDTPCYTVCDGRTLSPSAGRHAFPLDFLPNAFTLSSLSLSAAFSSGAQ